MSCLNVLKGSREHSAETWLAPDRKQPVLQFGTKKLFSKLVSKLVVSIAHPSLKVTCVYYAVLTWVLTLSKDTFIHFIKAVMDTSVLFHLSHYF